MIKKIKVIISKSWICFQKNCARAEEIHRRIEARKIEDQLKYQNLTYRNF